MSEMSRRTVLLGGVAGAATTRRQRPSPATRLEGVGAGLVADALRGVGLDPRSQTMSSEIRPVVGASAPVAGPAITTRWEPARETMADDAIRRFVFEPVDAAPVGAVWVVASGTEGLVSMFGDLIALACKRNGLVGAVTDSGCRDVASMREMGFPVFAKGTVLYGPGALIQPAGANVPVTCGGVDVRPGDWIVADVDGVIVVPSQHLDEVVDVTRTLMAKEEGVRRSLESGASLASAYKL